MIASAVVSERWIEAYNAHDLTALMRLYAETADLTTPDGDHRSIEGISGFWGADFDRCSRCWIRPDNQLMQDSQIVTQWSASRTGDGGPIEVVGIDVITLDGERIVHHDVYYHRTPLYQA